MWNKFTATSSNNNPHQKLFRQTRYTMEKQIFVRKFVKPVYQMKLDQNKKRNVPKSRYIDSPNNG